MKVSLAEEQKVAFRSTRLFFGKEIWRQWFLCFSRRKDQYEETEASLIALQSKIQKGNWVLKPNIYWRRGQDHYLYLERNLKSMKIGT